MTAKRIFTIGYEGATQPELIAALREAGVERLIDVRAARKRAVVRARLRIDESLADTVPELDANVIVALELELTNAVGLCVIQSVPPPLGGVAGRRNLRRPVGLRQSGCRVGTRFELDL